MADDQFGRVTSTYPSLDSFRNRNDAVRALVLDRFETSKKAQEAYFVKIKRWYDLYRGWYRDPNQPDYRNNVFIPMTFSTVWSDVARKSNAIFGAHPYVAMVGYGDEDYALARQQELLVSAQMRDARSHLKGIDAFLSGDLYGTAIAQVGWTYDEEVMQMRGQVASPITGQLLEQVRSENYVKFDGPDWEVLDRLDFFPQPRIARIWDMRWKIRRYWLELDDVRALSAKDFFDKVQLNALELLSPPTDIEADYQQRAGYMRNELFSMERYSKPVEIIEMWGVVPSELVGTDGVARRVISLANRQVVLRNRPNPYGRGEDPFLAYTPVVDPHHFDGPSKVELGEHLNAVANRLVSNRLDVLDQVVSPAYAYDSDALGVSPDQLYVRPNRWIPVEGLSNGTLQPLNPDLRGFQLSHQEVEYAWRWLQNASGIHEDAVMGAAGPDRETARGFLGRQAAVNTRLLLETRICEEQLIEPLANWFRSLNRLFLPVPLKRHILGTKSIVDSLTGLPVPEEISVSPYALNKEYDARALGSSQMLPKEMRQQNFLQLLQVVAATPLSQVLNWITFGRQAFQLFDFPNVDELFLAIPPLQQIALNMMNAQGQAGQRPVQQPGAAPLPNLPGGEGGQSPLQGSLQDTLANGTQPGAAGPPA